MKLSDLVMIAAVLIGPIAAVLITLWHQERKQRRDQKLTLLRHVLAFRQLPGDANFSHSINMIPLEFADVPAVLLAHKEFIAAAYAKQGAESDEEAAHRRGVKQTRLIYEMAHSLGFAIRETDLQTEAYTASGFAERELLFLDSQRAWRDIANILWMQTRLAAGEDWATITSQGSNEAKDAAQIEKEKK